MTTVSNKILHVEFAKFVQNNLLENLLIVNYALEKIECNLYNKIITDIDLVAYGISEQLKNKNISHNQCILINYKKKN